MTPGLARSGRFVAATGALATSAGAILAAPALAVIGSVVLSALLTAYLAFYPTAVMLRRRRVELSWWLAEDAPRPEVPVGKPFGVAIALRNRGFRPLRIRSLEIVSASAIADPDPLCAEAPPGTEIELRAASRARAPGYHVLHGAVVSFGDAFGLFEARAYFPTPLEVAAAPRSRARARKRAFAPRSRAAARAGRRRGVAGDVRELRDHRPGDPFRHIAWKATARRGRLIVREYEEETPAAHQILLDVSGPMRDGPVGQRPLDAALASAWELGEWALARGDRVGVTAFSTEIVAEISPAAGSAHRSAVRDLLLDLERVYREGETDLEPAEIAASVARYLAYQEGADVRLRRAPPPGDPAWNHTAVGPSGELLDLALMARIALPLAEAMAERRKGRAYASRALAAAGDPRLFALRQLCRFRGIELPPRRDAPAEGRAAALAEAASARSASARADTLTLISDLDCVLGDPDRALAPIERFRRRGGHARALASPRPLPDPSAARGAAERRAAEILAQDLRERLERARLLLRARRVSVTELPSPEGG